MKSQQKDRLREMQLAFVGKLMATLSHESKNHLAIIRESSGLIEDLLSIEEPGQSTNSERYKKIIAGIDERVSQAAEMCRFLSSFSHRMDLPLSSFSVADLILEEIYLLRRIAQQKQVHLVSSFEENLPVIFNDPALLQFAIFCIVWPALETLEKENRILISATRKDASVNIVVTIDDARKEAEGVTHWQEILPEALQMLGAEHSRRITPEGKEEVSVIISSIEDPYSGKI